MKNKIAVMIIPLLFNLLTAINLQGQQTSKTNADILWKRLDSIRKFDLKDYDGKSREERRSITEIRQRRYREEGLKFWNNYPDDRRKYIWFSNTCKSIFGSAPPVNYWSSPNSISIPVPQEGLEYTAKLDINALKEWEDSYPKLLNEYLENSSKELNELGQEVINGESILSNADILIHNLRNFFGYFQNTEYRKYKKIDISQIHDAVYKAAIVAINDTKLNPNHRYSKWGDIKKIVDYNIMKFYYQIGLNLNDVKFLMGKFINDGNPFIQEFGMQKMSLLALMKKPFELKHQAIDGSTVDLKLLKGKVVLVDFWSTACSSCIAMMPLLRRVYETHQKNGFEVISICINPETDREAIIKIKNKIGASWPTLLAGGKGWDDKKSLYKQIFDAYGFRGVPQLLLLDRDGKLIMYQGELRFTNKLAEVVEKAVAQK